MDVFEYSVEYVVSERGLGDIEIFRGTLVLDNAVGHSNNICILINVTRMIRL